MLSPWRKLVPASMRLFLGAFRARRRDLYRWLERLPVADSGVDQDNVPFVTLTNGLTFFGYLPTPTDRMLYRAFLSGSLKSRLDEEAVRVAADVAYRYLGPPDSVDPLQHGKYSSN